MENHIYKNHKITISDRLHKLDDIEVIILKGKKSVYEFWTMADNDSALKMAINYIDRK